MRDLERMGREAKAAAAVLGRLGTEEKDLGLEMAAQSLLEGAKEIQKANEEDMAAARKKGMKPGLLDRLMLNEERIRSMAEGLRQVAKLDDPIGSFILMKKSTLNNLSHSSGAGSIFTLKISCNCSYIVFISRTYPSQVRSITSSLIKLMQSSSVIASISATRTSVIFTYNFLPNSTICF